MSKKQRLEEIANEVDAAVAEYDAAHPEREKQVAALERRIREERVGRDAFSLGWQAALYVLAYAANAERMTGVAQRILDCEKIPAPETFAEAMSLRLGGIFR